MGKKLERVAYFVLDQRALLAEATELGGGECGLLLDEVVLVLFVVLHLQPAFEHPELYLRVLRSSFLRLTPFLKIRLLLFLLLLENQGERPLRSDNVGKELIGLLVTV